MEGVPSFHIGAAVNPCVDDVETEISKCKKKIEQGAEFFQTQAVYDLVKFKRFCHLYKKGHLHPKRLVNLKKPVFGKLFVAVFEIIELF